MVFHEGDVNFTQINIHPIFKCIIQKHLCENVHCNTSIKCRNEAIKITTEVNERPISYDHMDMYSKYM